MWNKNRFTSALLVALSGCAAVAHADTSFQGNSLAEFLAQTTVTGQIRAYYFDRFFGKDAANLSAFSLGGFLNAHTPSAAGISADVGFYTANSLGANTVNPDVTLMGKAPSITALGQAYLQYAIPDVVMIRAGDQEIDTPFVNGSDSRMIPATFQGISAQVTPCSGWNIYGMRMFSWKSRTSAGYYRDNLYYQTDFDGDPLYGGVAVLPSAEPDASGVLAIGTRYKNHGADAQAWYYDFYGFTAMFYGDARYTLETDAALRPFVGGQVVREWDGNSRLNASNGAATIADVSGNRVSSAAWGVQAGVNYDLGDAALGNGEWSLAYNQINYRAGAVGGGAIVSPYTVGYATDPLYTTSMTRGLVEMGPGTGWRVKWTQHFLGNHLQFTAAYARYSLHSAGKANDVYGDLTYFPGGFLRGLSIRDRVDVAHGGGLPGRTGYFIYNRVMLTYAF